MLLQIVELVVQGRQHVPQPNHVEPVVQAEVVKNPGVILVNRNDNVDEVLINVQQQNLEAHNNIANLVWHECRFTQT